MKKVVIVDDEDAGRTLISQYLKHHPDMIVVGEANNGVDAVRIINKFAPDLVFMDVQMPGMTGFEVLGYLEELPNIIFSTAYDQYALQAFEVHALDYLLKPYTRERFDTALAKVNKSENLTVLPLAEEQLAATKDYPDRVIVQKGSKYITISTSDIEYIEAYGDYAKIFTAEDQLLSNNGLGALEEKLDPKEFMRVHRSTILRLDHAQEISKIGKGFVISTTSGKKVRVSRSYAQRIKDLMV
ncbi:MAG: LytTR family DNA-binding domain-containing protein [Nonlabens sp.]